MLHDEQPSWKEVLFQILAKASWIVIIPSLFWLCWHIDTLRLDGDKANAAEIHYLQQYVMDMEKYHAELHAKMLKEISDIGRSQDRLEHKFDRILESTCLDKNLPDKG